MPVRVCVYMFTCLCGDQNAHPHKFEDIFGTQDVVLVSGTVGSGLGIQS